MNILFVTSIPADPELVALAAEEGHRLRQFASPSDAVTAAQDAREAVLLLDLDAAPAVLEDSTLQHLAGQLPAVVMASAYARAIEAMRQGASDALLCKDGSPPPATVLRALEEARVRWLAESRTRSRQQEVGDVARLTAMRHVLSDLAHDLNQPLSAILNYARGALRGLDAGMPEERIRTALDVIGGQAERASQMLAELRAALGSHRSMPRCGDINALVRAALELLADDMRLQGISPVLELAPGLPPARMDERLIEQVLLSVVRNAIEAMEGLPPAQRRLRLRTRALSGAVEVSVDDGGPGMNAETRERAFDAFFSTKAHGLGIGLSISRAIVGAHEGTFTLDESEWGGCACGFTLPLGDEDDASRGEALHAV